MATVGGVLAGTGLLWPAANWLCPVGGLVWLCAVSLLIGIIAFSEERSGFQAAFGALGAIALIATLGAIVYWFWRLDNLAVATMLVATPWLIFAFSPLLERKPGLALPVLDDVRRSRPADIIAVGLLALTVGSDAAALRSLAESATSEAIRSPWDVTHPIFFLWLFVGTVALVGLAARSRYRHLTLCAAGLHLFTLLAPALLIYAIGYGFDPFVHVATEALIAAHGVVTPKTPYYLGQYAIVTVFARLFRLPIESVDHLLVPGLAAVYLPISAVYLLRRGFKLERSVAMLSTLGLFLLPIAPFVVTTPQGLADLFAIVAAMLGAAWLHDHRPSLAYLLVLVAASLAIHPLVGVPAALIIAFIAIFKLRAVPGAVKAVFFAVIFLASIVALPMMFAWNAARSGGTAGFDVGAVISAFTDAAAHASGLLPTIETRFRPALDFVQLVAGNLSFVVLALAAFGIFILSRTRGYRRTAWAASACGVGLLISAFALQHGLTVAGVIGYEQQNYGNRLFETTELLLAPAVLAAVAWWWRKTLRANRIIKVFAALLFAGVTTSAAYAAFPRNDAYTFNRGWSVSRHDLQAVRTVDEKAGGEPYVALADQSVSAAALRTFGFRTYYGDQYFYAIPTGGALYQSYLAMVYGGAKRQTIRDAMEAYGVKRAYFILNKYWNDFDKIDKAASKTADSRFEVDGGAVVVYEYRLTKP